MELGYPRTELRRQLVDAVLRGEKSARMTCNLIAGEFREFKEEFNSLAEHVSPAKV